MLNEEKILEKKINNKFDNKFMKKINDRLATLKEESPWSIKHKWDKKNKKLMVQTNELLWKVFFKSSKLEVYVEAPAFLNLLFIPFKKRAAQVLIDEINILDN